MANENGGGAGERNDPLLAFTWALKIDDLKIDSQTASATAIFRECTGLKMERQATDYHIGGVRDYTHKILGIVKWTNIKLARGFTGDKALFEWKTNPRRINGLIIHLGPDLQPKITFRFKKGFPAKWTGPNFDASKNEIGIESIEIAHEGLEIVT